MNDFDFDALEKKRIAGSARHRVNGCTSRYCGLPSDHLTDSEIKKLSGPVQTYNLAAPMTWEQFKLMPEDLQVQYLTSLHTRFGAGLSTVSTDLFHGCATLLRGYFRSKGIPTDRLTNKRGQHATNDEVFRWKSWLRQDGAPKPEGPEATPIAEAVKPEAVWDIDSPDHRSARRSTEAPDPVHLHHVEVVFGGDFTRDSLAEYIRGLSLPEGNGITVRLVIDT